jgi:hypothetical protein
VAEQVTTTTVFTYLSGWLVTAIGAYAAARHVNDRHEPSSHLLCVSVVAGALWPLLFVGLVELSSLVVLTKAQSKAEPGVAISA